MSLTVVFDVQSVDLFDDVLEVNGDPNVIPSDGDF